MEREQVDKLSKRISLNEDGFPLCDFCLVNNGKRRKATHLGQQYALREGDEKDCPDPKITSHWAFCCQGHAEGWNEGGDYIAKVFKLDDVTDEM